jgi:hypothetical protein
MPFDIHIDPEVNCVFFRSTGPHIVEFVSPMFELMFACPSGALPEGFWGVVAM